MLLSSDCCMYIILIWHAVMYGQHGARKPKISPRQEELGVTGAGGATGPSHNGSNSKQLIKIINSGRDRGATIRKGKGAKVLPLAKSKWNLLLDGVKLSWHVAIIYYSSFIIAVGCYPFRSRKSLVQL